MVECQHSTGLQQEVDMLNVQLEKKKHELIITRSKLAGMSQSFVEIMIEQANKIKEWKFLHSEEAKEAEKWRAKFERVIPLINEAVLIFSNIYE